MRQTAGSSVIQLGLHWIEAEAGEPLVEARKILHVARQAVERLDDDGLEPALPRGAGQP